MRKLLNDNEGVPSGSASSPGVPLTGKRQVIPLRNSRRNVNFKCRFFLHAALSMADFAPFADRTAGSLAGRAYGYIDKLSKAHGPHLPQLTGAVAGRTCFDGRPVLRTDSRTGRALLQMTDLDFLFNAIGNFFEGQRDWNLNIRSAFRSVWVPGRATTKELFENASSPHTAKNIGEMRKDIVGILIMTEIVGTDPLMAEPVVARALV